MQKSKTSSFRCAKRLKTHYLRALRRDTYNLFHGYPIQYAQQIWINPNDVKLFLNPQTIPFPVSKSHRELSGLISDQPWDDAAIDLSDVPQYREVTLRFFHGYSWGETGAIERLHSLLKAGKRCAGCTTTKDIYRRFGEIDRLYSQIQQSKRLKTRAEVDACPFRELNGVFIHVDSQARPLFGSGGAHRLFISQLVELTTIPAQVGLVHPNALKTHNIAVTKIGFGLRSIALGRINKKLD